MRLEREFGPEHSPQPGYYRTAFSWLQQLTRNVERERTGQWDHTSRAPIFKITNVGDPSVGKTALYCRFLENRFGDHTYMFYKADFTNSDFQVSPKRFPSLKICRAQMWDFRASFHTRFRMSSESQWRWASGVIAAFDLTSAESFNNLASKWIPEVLKFAPANRQFIVVGLKSDLCPEQRQVSGEDARRLAAELCCPYVEVSSKTGENVDRVILHIVGKALEAHLAREKPATQPLPPPPAPPLVPSLLPHILLFWNRFVSWSVSWLWRE